MNFFMVAVGFMPSPQWTAFPGVTRRPEAEALVKCRKGVSNWTCHQPARKEGNELHARKKERKRDLVIRICVQPRDQVMFNLHCDFRRHNLASFNTATQLGGSDVEDSIQIAHEELLCSVGLFKSPNSVKVTRLKLNGKWSVETVAQTCEST